MDLRPALLAAVMAASSAPAADAPAVRPARHPEAVALDVRPLWEGAAPASRGEGPDHQPSLAVLPAPAGRANGTAVVVCPGGGYWVRAMDHEGLQVARWLNRLGIHAFLVSYRLRADGYTPEEARLDAARAVRWVRSRAGALGVDPSRIGMIGFSAGAHLISAVAEKADAGDPASADPAERVSSRPDFLLMVYGSPSVYAWEDARPIGTLPPDFPPVFMALTTTDFVRPHGCLRLLEELRDRGSEAELHVFGGDGAHGRGLHTGDPDTGKWPDLAHGWMRRNALLASGPRAAVAGRVTIDGQPLFMGWITLTPLDHPDAPPASVHASDADTKRFTDGRFAIEAKFGPLPGRHRVEVREQARDLIRVPTLPDERLHTSLTPGGAPIEVDIRPGTNELILDLRTRS